MGWFDDRERDDGYTAFVRSASPALGRTAWFLTGDVHAAEELVQATLVKLYVAWPRIRRGEELAYARRTLVNTSTDTWRKRRRERLTDETPERPTPAGTRVEDRDELVRLLQELPEQQRRVVVLRYYSDLSEQGVADVLGISVGAVKSAASRGLARLRTHLETPKEGLS